MMIYCEYEYEFGNYIINFHVNSHVHGYIYVDVDAHIDLFDACVISLIDIR